MKYKCINDIHKEVEKEEFDLEGVDGDVKGGWLKNYLNKDYDIIDIDVDVGVIDLEDSNFIYKYYYSDLVYLYREFECLSV